MSKYQFGAVYVIEPEYTMEDYRTDLQNMKNCGFNLITIWPVSNGWLANSSTEWLFDETIKVLNICQELGIKAILQLFGQNHGYEFMPDSLLTEEMMVDDEKGKTFNSNCIWASLNNPVVRECIENYFKTCILKLKNHPAVYGWDVFNEAHFRSDDKYTIDEYHKWLKNKYMDINVLNRKWHRRYETFSQVNPRHRRCSYSIWSNQLPTIEYEKFRSENLTDICKFLYNTAKQYDDTHPIIIDGTSSNILYDDMTQRNNDEFNTALIPDVYGATFYPKSWGRNYKDEPWKIAMYYNIPAGAARKAKKPYMVTELQTHTQSALTPGSEVEPYELMHWMLMTVFSGTIGLQLWRWRPFLHGYQSTGRGLTNIAGRPNKRAAVTKQLTDIIYSNDELFDDIKLAKPSVKIAYSYNSRLHFDSFFKWAPSFWPDCINGWHRIFWDKGLVTDFCDLEALDDEDLNSPVIVLPTIIALNGEIEEKLAKYVENGGILIADARLGTVNYDAVVPKTGIPGPVLSKVFGIIEEDVGSGNYMTVNNEKYNITFMNQILETVGDTKVLATMNDGSPAITINNYGKGKAVYFNSLIGFEMNKNYNADISKLVFDLVKDNCKGVPVFEKSEKVHTTFVNGKSKDALLVLNFADEESKIVLDGYFAGKQIKDLVSGEIISCGESTEIKLSSHKAAIYIW